MADTDGPVIAKTIYEEIFHGESENLEPDTIPYALDAAVEKLRDARVPPVRWAPYVHYGI
jgi:hypothetical protein